jgi:hypothetical protein
MTMTRIGKHPFRLDVGSFAKELLLLGYGVSHVLALTFLFSYGAETSHEEAVLSSKLNW